MINFLFWMLDNVFHFIADTPKTNWYVFLFTFFSIYYVIQKFRRDPRLKKSSKELPGPNGLPLVGSTLPFLFSGLGGVNRVLLYYSQTYGSVYKFWLGNELVIGLANVNHLEVIFRSTKTLSKPKILFEGYKEQFGNSLFTCSSKYKIERKLNGTVPVPVWKTTRKRLQPIFGKNVMKVQIPLLREYVDKFVDQTKNHVNGPEFNIKDYLQCLATDSFLGIYYDFHLTTKETEYFKFHEIFDSSADYAFAKMIFPWLRTNYTSKLYFGNHIASQQNKLGEFFRLLKFPEQAQTVEDCDSRVNPKKSLLSVIQQLEDEMKIENYAFNEVTNFIIAVSGTTARTISFCLLAIAMHPDIQSKLFDEIYNIFGDGNRSPNFDDLSKLPYLDQVVKESHRRFTILRNIFREAEEDIKIGTLTIPAKSTIMVRIGDIHMNPDIYPNPEEFNPDNFSAEAVRQRSKYSFLPLSSGIRDCIGKNLADSIIKLTVISLMRKFKLRTTIQMKDIDYTGAFSVNKRGGFWLSIEARN